MQKQKLTFNVDKLVFARITCNFFLSRLLSGLPYAHNHPGPLHHEVYDLVLVRLVLLITSDSSKAFQDDSDEEVEEDNVEHQTEETEQYRTNNFCFRHHGVIIKLV